MSGSSAFPSFSFQPQTQNAEANLEKRSSNSTANRVEKREKGRRDEREDHEKEKPRHHHDRGHKEKTADQGWYWLDTRGTKVADTIAYEPSCILTTQIPGTQVTESGTVKVPLDLRPRRSWRNTILPDPVVIVDGSEVSEEKSLQIQKARLEQQLKTFPENERLWLSYARVDERLSRILGVHKALSDQRLSSFFKQAGDHASEYLTSQSIELSGLEQTGQWKAAAKRFGTKRCFIKWIDTALLEWSGLDALEMVDELIKDDLIDLALQTSTAVYLEVIRKLTDFMANTGYQERAVAIWQALIELTLFRPKVDKSHAVVAFMQYWDMETARFGDCGAKKWKDIEANEPVDMNSHIRGMPWRSLIALDPYQVVLSKDIAPLLHAMDVDRIEDLLFYLLSFFGAQTPIDTECSTLFTRQFDRATCIEFLKQITHTSLQLPPKFLAWSLKFLHTWADKEVYGKYSRHVLKRFADLSLYFQLGELEAENGSIDSANSIFQNVATRALTEQEWSRLVGDLLTYGVSIDLEHLLVYYEQKLGPGGKFSGFLYQYCTIFHKEHQSRHSTLILEALITYWLEQTKFKPEMSEILDILMTHAMGRLGLGTKIPDLHIKNVLNLLDQDDSRFFESLKIFQTKYHRSWITSLLDEKSDPVRLRAAHLGLLPLRSVLNTKSGPAWLHYLKKELELAKNITGEYFTLRQLFLSGLRNCGWYLDLFEFGLEHLGHVLSEEEIKEIKAIMVERAFRLRTEV